MELHIILSQKRKQAGYTQKELAEILNMSTYQMVSNWERGICQPPLGKITDLARCIGMDKDKLFKLVMTEKEKKAKRKAKLN